MNSESPVETLAQHAKNWIVDFGEDHVVVRSDKTGNRQVVSWLDIRGYGAKQKSSIARALRALAFALWIQAEGVLTRQ